MVAEKGASALHPQPARDQPSGPGSRTTNWPGQGHLGVWPVVGVPLAEAHVTLQPLLGCP